MKTENEIRNYLQIAISKRDSKEPDGYTKKGKPIYPEFWEYTHLEGYIKGLKVALNQTKPKYNKEDI